MDHPCFCGKDQDGRCAKCVADIGQFTTRMVEKTIGDLRALKEIQESWNKICCVCSLDNLDYAICKVVRALTEDRTIIDDDFLPIFANLIRQMTANVKSEDGPKQWPLTEKALDDLKAANG